MRRALSIVLRIKVSFTVFLDALVEVLARELEKALEPLLAVRVSLAFHVLPNCALCFFFLVGELFMSGRLCILIKIHMFLPLNILIPYFVGTSVVFGFASTSK